MFSDIGSSPPGSGYIALQYWGNYFGKPSKSPYYFIIDIDSSTKFKIAPKDSAAKHGRLGILSNLQRTDTFGAEHLEHLSLVERSKLPVHNTESVIIPEQVAY